MRTWACASRSSPPSASPGPRPAAWPTSSMPWRGPSGELPGDVGRRAGRRLPAAVPGRAGATTRRGPRRDGRGRPGSAGAAGSTRRDHRRRRRRRLPPAPRRPPAGVRPGRRSTATRPATTPTTRGGSGCSAGPRWRRCGPRDGRSTSSTCTTGRPARRRCSATLRYARRPDHRPGGDRADAPQPRLPRLDRRRGAAAARPAAGRRRARPERRRHRPAGGRHRGGRDRQHGVAGLRARGADARRSGWASTGCCGRAATGSSGSSTASTPTSGIRPPTRPSPRRTRAGDLAGKAACRADLLTPQRDRPGDTGPVIGMIGRLDPQKGFDLLADAAPALLERGARLIVQGAGHPSLADPFRALAAASAGQGRAHRALRPRRWRAGSTPAPTSS